MKTTRLRLSAFLLALTVGTLHAQRNDEAPVVIERGANYNIIQVEAEPDEALMAEMDAAAQRRYLESLEAPTYTELASGLNYLNEGEWTPSVAVFENFEEGIVARQGQTKVILNHSLNHPLGSVDMLASDGGRMRSSVFGIAYFDRLTGQSVMIAGRKESRAVLVPPNQAVYLDAFEGDVVADLRYTYRIGGFEQDVILRENPPSPLEYGLNPETTVLEVWTEFAEAPVPQQKARVLKEAGEQERDLYVEPDLIDSRLDFGAIQMVQGKAFALTDVQGEPQEERSREVLTAKRWQDMGEDGLFLIEAVDYLDVAEDLSVLPEAQANADREPAEGRQEMMAAIQREPLHRVASVDIPAWGEALTAVVEPSETLMSSAADFTQRPGYVLDYVTISANQSNYTFRGDETYLISAPYTFSGTTTFQGGAVIKYDYDAYIELTDNEVVFETEMYLPVTFTAKTDGTIGINVASHDPYQAYYPAALRLSDSGGTVTIKHTRFRYAVSAIDVTGSSVSLYVWHSQFVDCSTSVEVYYYDGVFLYNVLAVATDPENNDNYLFDGNSGTNSLDLAHVTADSLTDVAVNGGSSYITMNNSLLTAHGNSYFTPDSGTGNSISGGSSSGVYQTVGAGHFYLANGSTHRNKATGTINSTLEADLQKRTTYPPVYLDGVTLTEDTVWSPVVQRDDDGILDRGYHYAPIDYASTQVLVDGADLTITAGTALASLGVSIVRAGVGSNLYVTGTVEAPVKFMRYEVVQEEPTRLDYGELESQGHYYLLFSYNFGNPDFVIDYAVFYLLDKWYQMSFNNNDVARVDDFVIKNSRFMNGRSIFGSNETTDTFEILNNQFIRGRFYVEDKGTIGIHNNLFQDMIAAVFNQDSGVGTWTVRDNVFNKTTIYDTWNGTLVTGYNGFSNTSYRINETTYSSDVVVTSLTFESGPFGDYYIPPSFFGDFEDEGSRSASVAGLHHHGIQVHGYKDTGTVDIGFHYPATGERPVLHWAFDDGTGSTAKDVSGNGYVGTLSGLPSWTTGPVGGALDFDGTNNDYVSRADNSALEPSDITISMWFNADAFSSATATAFLTKRSSSSNGYFVLLLDTTDRLYFDWGGSSGSNRWDTGYYPPTGQWTHIALTRSSAGRELYVNGQLFSSTSNTGGTSLNTTAALRVGLDSYTTNYDFNGKIDDIRIYNRRLTSSEVSSVASLVPYAMDTDGDGIADYIEDENGDGVANDTTDWDDSENGTGSDELQVFTVLED